MKTIITFVVVLGLLLIAVTSPQSTQAQFVPNCCVPANVSSTGITQPGNRDKKKHLKQETKRRKTNCTCPGCVCGESCTCDCN